jgi:hypothetical protein
MHGMCIVASERMSGGGARRKKGGGSWCCMVFSPARISHAVVNVSVALSNQVAFCSKTDKKRSLTSRRFRSSSSSSSLSISSSVFFISLLLYKVIVEFRFPSSVADVRSINFRSHILLQFFLRQFSGF